MKPLYTPQMNAAAHRAPNLIHIQSVNSIPAA